LLSAMQPQHMPAGTTACDAPTWTSSTPWATASAGGGWLASPSWAYLPAHLVQNCLPAGGSGPVNRGLGTRGNPTWMDAG
jgi:hypothetical protein